MENGLVIQVDFYKDTGKWYSGGRVNIGDTRLWHGDEKIKQAIIDNQEILSESWIGQFNVVTSDLPETEDDPNYREFTGGLFFANAFDGMKKTKNCTTVKRTC